LRDRKSRRSNAARAFVSNASRFNSEAIVEALASLSAEQKLNRETHAVFAGIYLLRYAQEASWREDHRRISNGDQVHAVSWLAMKRGPSIDFSGYWQRHSAT
jgi:hypothetical protein